MLVQARISRPYGIRLMKVPYDVELLQRVTHDRPPFEEYSMLFFVVLIRNSSLPVLMSCEELFWF